MVSARLRPASERRRRRRRPSALTAGPRDDDRLHILPCMRLPQVVEQALQHCRQQGRGAEWAESEGVSEASGRCPVALRNPPAGCRALTGGLCSVTTPTPSATSRVVRGGILAARGGVQPPTIAVRLAGGALGAQGVRGGVLSWHLGSGGSSVLLAQLSLVAVWCSRAF